MKKHYWITLAVLAGFLVIAQQSHATNGHQLSAIGAYQQGLGGAVTAAPYDATTAITNPAGMAVIGNRTDFNFELFRPTRTTGFAGGGNNAGGSPFYLVPAVGWTAPVNDRGDVFFGGGMYGVSGMGVDYDTLSDPAVAGMMGWGGGAQAHIYSQYQFWKMAPTLAWKRGKLALGFALNLDYQAFSFKNMWSEVGGAGKYGLDLSEMQGALGYGATLGVLYQPVPAFTVGFTYASRQMFSDFKWRLSAGDVSLGPVASQDGTYKMKLNFPEQAALGFAVRPTRKALWTVDFKWINYSATYNVVKLKGPFTNGVTEVPLHFGWEDVWVIATGFQYEVTPNVVLRMGYNHSNSPIKAEDVDNNLAFPAIVRDHISGGFTYRLGRHWEMSMAYMNTMKEEVKSNSGTGTKISLEEKAGDFELSYRF